eukprot:151985-Chlamydomonas_euryale.AAC.1
MAHRESICDNAQRHPSASATPAGQHPVRSGRDSGCRPARPLKRGHLRVQPQRGLPHWCRPQGPVCVVVRQRQRRVLRPAAVGRRRPVRGRLRTWPCAGRQAAQRASQAAAAAPGGRGRAACVSDGRLTCEHCAHRCQPGLRAGRQAAQQPGQAAAAPPGRRRQAVPWETCLSVTGNHHAGSRLYTASCWQEPSQGWTEKSDLSRGGHNLVLEAYEEADVDTLGCHLPDVMLRGIFASFRN